MLESVLFTGVEDNELKNSPNPYAPPTAHTFAICGATLSWNCCNIFAT